MSEKKSLLLSLLGLSVPLFFYFPPLTNPLEKYRLVVAVSSRIANFQNRRTIRATWKNSLPSNVLFKFVLSESSCSIDPLWRLNSEGCEPWDIAVPSWVQDGLPLVPFSADSSASAPLYPSYTGLTFTVKTFGIVVHQLGIASSLVNLRQTVSLILWSKQSGRILKNLTFSSTDSKLEGEFYTFKPVEGKGLELSAGFEGWLYLQGGRGLERPARCSVKVELPLGHHGVFRVTGLKEAKNSQVEYRRESCPLVNLEYSLLDPQDVKLHLGARETQNKVEERRTLEQEKDVDEELEDNEDIIFIPTTDSILSTSTNIKVFLSYLEGWVDYEYILLTTDSSLVNIDAVLSGLAGHNSWWGSFNFFSKCSETDRKYASLTFPPMPRTNSFVLARELGYFIGRNYASLADFSSLTKSLSVWLSALDVDLVDDDGWLGGPGVENRTRFWRDGKLIALEQLNGEQLESAWKD